MSRVDGRRFYRGRVINNGAKASNHLLVQLQYRLSRFLNGILNTTHTDDI